MADEAVGGEADIEDGSHHQTAGGHPLGIVVAIAQGFALVHTADGDLLCTYRGRLRPRPAPGPAPRPSAAGRSSASGRARKSGSRSDQPVGDQSQGIGDAPSRVAPGDQVRVTSLGADRGVVEEVLARRTAITRSAGEAGGGHVMLANLDHALLVFAVRDPVPHFGMLDRYLAMCEHAGIVATICLNKVDLGISAEVSAAAQVYSALGYHVLFTSAVSKAHVTEVAESLGGRVTLVTGPSGVGKSSLINLIVPDASQRTGDVSSATGKGRHTTTGARLLPLTGGGWLADTAGIRELALWNVSPDVLPRCFVELRAAAGGCEFEDCTHGEHETGCALRAVLEEGKISPQRYASFARLLLEARGETGRAG